MGRGMRIAAAATGRIMTGTSERHPVTIPLWGHSMCTGRATGTAICAGMTRVIGDFAKG